MKKFVLISLLAIPFCKAADVGGNLSKIKVWVGLVKEDEKSGRDRYLKTFIFEDKVNLKKETLEDLEAKILSHRALPKWGALSIKKLVLLSGDHENDINLFETKEFPDTLDQAGIRENATIKAYLKQEQDGEYGGYIKGE